MTTIAAQLSAYQQSLDAALAGGKTAEAKKLEEQIQNLKDYQQRHPDETEAPSPMEVFCDLNPSDINCLVYDD